MKIFAIATLAAAASAVTIGEKEYNFLKYIAEHGKQYESVAEFEFRQALFLARDELIREHNASGKSWTLGHNRFSDLTATEYRQFLGFDAKQSNGARLGKRVPVKGNDYVDWRDSKAVTDVKDQGACGSCWSFSTTGAVEGAYAIAHGDLIPFSEQQLMDCSYAQGNLSCGGGLMDSAFEYLETAPLETEEDYPYEMKFKFSCGADASKGVAQVTSFEDVPVNQPDQLIAYLQKGPVSVAIEADMPVFGNYVGGIISGPECGIQLDHGVLAVGYGNEDGQDYITVKNSWGPSWGESGYVRLAVADAEGTCGINQSASQPYVA